MTKVVQSMEMYDTINPKLLEPSFATDRYVNCQQQGFVNDGTMVEFWLPNDCICKLSNSYLQINVNPTNVIAPIAEVYTFTALVPWTGTAASASGTFQILIGDNATTPLPFNATNLQILTALSTLNGLANEIQLVTDPAVSPQPFSQFQITANTITTGASPASLSFSINYDSLKLKKRNIPVRLISNLLNGAGAPLIFQDLSPANDGDYLYPRFDGSGIGSLIDEVIVTIANKPISDVQEYGRLWSALIRTRLTETADTENALLYGIAKDGFNGIGYRQKYICPLLGIGAFSKIYPLSLIPGSPLMKIQIKFKRGSDCLCYPDNVSPTPNYQVYDMRFYFTDVTYRADDTLGNTEPPTITQFKEQIRDNRLTYYFEDYKQLTQPGVSTADETVQVNPTVKRLLAVFAMSQQVDFISDTTNRFRLSSFPTFQVNKGRLYAGTTTYPNDYIMSINENDYAEWLVEALSTFGQWSSLNEDLNVMNSELLSAYTYTLPYHTVYQKGYLQDVPPSFVVGITTNDDTADKMRDSNCVYPQGIDASKLSQVLLQLYGMQLISPINTYTYCKHISELKIGTGSNGAAIINLDW